MAMWKPGIIFIGGETSGALRRRFQAAGHETYSCDLLPSEDSGEELAHSDDGLPLGRHLAGDMFDALDNLWANDLWPELAIFHPECTYLTNSGEWAFSDADYDRYPGVGYHQRVQSGTLTGKARRDARDASIAQVKRIIALPIRRKVIENPRGAIGTRIRPATQTVQPRDFGDDASKATCLWMVGKDGEPLHDMRLSRTTHVPPRLVDDGRPQLGLFGTGAPRWGNQSDSGQNRLTPSEDRWKERSRTYPGIADAMVSAWGPLLTGEA